MLQTRTASTLLALWMLAVGVSAETVEAAPGREVFRGHVSGNSTVKTPVGSISFSSTGVDGTVDLSFSPAETVASRERSGATQVTLGTAITYKVTTRVTLSLPGDDKEGFTAKLDLKTGHGITCSAPTVTGGGRGGTSITLSSTVSCSESVVYMFWLTYASPFVTKAYVSATGDKGHSLGASAQVTSVYEFLEDELHLDTSTTPYQGTLLTAGSVVTFKGDVGVALESRSSGRVALRLFDQRGVLQGSSDFLAVTRRPWESDDGSQVRSTHTIKDVKIDGDGPTELRLRAVLFDASGSNVLMQTDDLVFPLKNRCDLEGAVVRAVPRLDASGSAYPYPYWMPGVLVDLMDGDKTASATVKAQKDPDNPHVESFYCIQLSPSLDYKKEYTLRVRLQDAENLSQATVAIYPNLGADPDKINPVVMRSRPFRLNKGVKNKQHFLVTADSLGLKGLEGEKAEAGAEAYWHIWRQLNRMSSELPDGFKLLAGAPLRVYLNREGLNGGCGTSGGVPRSCYCDSGTGGCPNQTSIVLIPGPSMPGADPSTLWHEFGHHLLHRLYEKAEGPAPGPQPPDPNHPGTGHGGYYNDFTTDSVDEGFATFWAVRSRLVLDNDASSMYFWNEPKPKSWGLPIEANFAAWDFRRASAAVPVTSKGAIEDLAFAGVLWDLVDTNADADTETFDKAGTPMTPQDTVSWDVKSLTTLLMNKIPGTVLAFHDALQDVLPPELRDPSRNPRGSGLSTVDEIFVMHRFFHDANGNWKFDLGERVGKAANGAPFYGSFNDEPIAPRPDRQDPPLIPGSFIDLALKTEGQRAVEESTVLVEQKFGAGFSSLNQRALLPVTSGRVYFPMPPPQYPVTVSLAVPDRPEPPVTFTDKDYAAKMGGGDTFLATTLIVPEPGPVTTALLPQRAAPGSSVTITGRNFAPSVGLNTVTFGATPASVSSVSEAGLLVTVPPSLGDGRFPVTVKTAAGESVPLEFESLTPVLAVSPTSLEFGTVYSGGLREISFTFRNSGLSDLTVLSAACTDPAFSISSPVPPFTIAPGASQTVRVAFRPPRKGSYGGTMKLSTNDPVQRVSAITLSGSGDSDRLGPAITLSPAAVDLGSVAVGQSRTVSVYVKSTGTADVSVNAATSDNAVVTVTPSPALPATLKYGYSASLELKFTPTKAGAITATVTITSTDPQKPVVSIPVFGQGVTSGASTCTWGLEPAVLSLGAGVGSGQITVTAPSNCTWTLAGSGFVTFPSGASGSGNTTVEVRVSANPGPSARSALVTLQGLTVRVEQDAPLATSWAFVPIVLAAAGAAGSYYTSELTLTNRGTTDAILTVTYTAYLGGSSGTGTDVLPAGAQVVFPDALAYLASIGIPVDKSGNRGGTIAIGVTGASSAGAVSATIRTATAVSRGRAGLAYPAIPRALTEPAYICGLRQNSSDRSNVAVMNTGGPDDGGITVRLTIISGDPARPQSNTVDLGLGPGAFVQISQALASNGLSIANGYVKAERIDGQAPFYVYGVINDQFTSDGSFVPPVLASAVSGKRSLTLPVAVEASIYTTDVVVTNFGSTSKSVRLTYVAGGIQTADHAASLDLMLAAGEQRVIPSFVQELRNRGIAGVGPAGSGFAGAVFATVPGGDVSGLAIGGRTSSPSPDGNGRFGVFYTGVPQGSAATDSAWLYGLQQNEQNRSNLAIINTGEIDDSGSSFRIEIFDGSTRTLVKTIDGVSVAARAFTQLSSILAQHAPGTSSAFARVTRVDGNNPFICYGVINDGGTTGVRSDDGAFIFMDSGEPVTPQPVISVSPATVEFGSVTVGQTAEKTLQVANTGSGILTVTALATTGTPFLVTAPAVPVSVSPGVQQAVSLRFSPASAGAVSGILTVTSNDPSRPSVSIPLSGTGVTPATPVLQLVPESLDFGKVNVGANKDLSFVIQNSGGAALFVNTIFVNHPAFSVTVPSLPVSVAAGAQLTVPVRFAPLAAGVLNIGVSIGTNDAARPSATVSLRGEGVAAATVNEELATDDGTLEGGFTADGYMIVNRLTPARYPATLKSVRLYYVQYSNLPNPSGTQVRVVALVDPAGSGSPAAGTALAVDQVVTLPPPPAGGGWIDLLLTNVPVVNSGDLYVGFQAPSSPSGVAFPADANGTPRRRGFFSTNGGATWSGPLVLIDRTTGAQTDVNVMIRALVSEPAP